MEWSEVLATNMVGWQILGIEAFGQSLWKGRVTRVVRDTDGVRFDYYQKQVCYPGSDENSDWRVCHVSEGSMFFHFNEYCTVHPVSNGYAVQVTHSGQYHLIRDANRVRRLWSRFKAWVTTFNP